VQRIFFICCLVSVFAIFVFCDRENQSEKLVFTSLTASDTIIKVGDFVNLTAIASGSRLRYKWEAKDDFNHSYPNFEGTGNSVSWYACHAYEFVIYCTVTDRYKNSEVKSVKIKAVY